MQNCKYKKLIVEFSEFFWVKFRNLCNSAERTQIIEVLISYGSVSLADFGNFLTKQKFQPFILYSVSYFVL